MPAVTALYAALIALLLLVLGVRVMLGRRRHRVGIGDGGNPALQQAVRVHANAVEWGLPVLALMLIAELNRAGPLLLHGAGIALVAGRILHAVGLSTRTGVSFGRASGMVLTWAALLVLALFDLWAFLRTLAV